MKDPEFTKGEWFAVMSDPALYQPGRDSHRIHSNGGKLIAHVRPIDANANLIACAPEMYEMLKILLDGDSINDSSIDKEVELLLLKAQGVSNE